MDLFNTLHVQSFGSSSAGNCTLVWDNESAILVDCGFPPRFTAQNLQRLRKNISEVSAAVITHSHSDHIHPVTVETLLRNKIPIYCHENVLGSLFRRFSHLMTDHYRKYFRTFDGQDFKINSLDIHTFEVPHDSEGGCFGYSITKGTSGNRKKVTISTDMGFPKPGLAEEFIDSDLIVIESNHDTEMLESSNRPAYLIQRIKDIGHLSNKQSAEFVVDIVNKSYKHPVAVMLAHISQQCNTNELAEQCMTTALKKNSFDLTRVEMTYKNMPSNLISI